MASQILVNVRPNMTRVAYVENKELTDYKVEKRRSPTHVGSIYKGKVLRVLPGMQAAFIDIGLKRSGFLYVGDVLENILANEEYMSKKESGAEDSEEAPSLTDTHDTPFKRNYIKSPIQDLLREGQSLLVQVAKDPLGTKGARVTTQISLPGRSLVYMPQVEHIGVSRRIENESERERLRKLVEGLKPDGGVIVRTAGESAEHSDLDLDLKYLQLVWSEVQKNYEKKKTVGLVYSDIDVELRALRDLLNDDVEKVIVDEKAAYKKIGSFLGQFMPNFKNCLEFYQDPQPLFDTYDIDIEISRSLQRKVWLKSGGYIVIDEAEALVVVDVNTGRYVGKKDLDDTILKTNLEAVREITHQLRIRNCGGIIILDLIDMENPMHREKVINQLEIELKKDRARTAIIHMSDLGLVEMTRKRTRPSLVNTLCEPCPYCEGKGYVKQLATVANEIFRSIEREITLSGGEPLDVAVSCQPQVANWIYEQEVEMLEHIESLLGHQLTIDVEPQFHVEEFEIRRQ
ncbi:MAG: Rne/Rng family ribonuclease [Bdellovibrionales bacterium]